MAEHGRRARRDGLLLAALQTALLLAIGGQMLVERITRPRGWGLTEPVDPNLPIRGRYVQLQLSVPAPGLRDAPQASQVRLVAQNGLVEAVEAGGPQPGASEPLPATIRIAAEGAVARLDTPLAFFLPPNVPDPSLRPRSGPRAERLWVEVTLPRRGAPRPIRLGVAPAGSTVITPLPTGAGSPPGSRR